MMSEEKAPIDIYEFLTIMTDQLAGLAWSKLGLQPDPITGTITTDLGQAKVAIDAVSALLGLVEPQLDEEDKRRIANLKTDLRMNYVQKVGAPT